MRTLSAFAVVGVCLGTLDISNVGGQGNVNWRQADSVAFGQNYALVEVSSTRRIRVTTTTSDGHLLHSTDLAPDTVKAWASSVRAELASPTRPGYQIENTILLQPARKGADSAGYVITIADSVGSTHQIFAALPGAGAFVGALSRVADRVPVLRDEELAQTGPLPRDATTVVCDRVRDSVFASLPSDQWPIARPADRPSSHPRPPTDAQSGVPVTASIALLPNGSLDSASFRVTGTTDTGYRGRALDFLSRQKWIPATVAGCTVPSRATLISMPVGFIRPR